MSKRAERLAADLCPDCGKERDRRPLLRCSVCSEKAGRTLRYRAENNLCRNCGEAKEQENRVRCNLCLKKSSSQSGKKQIRKEARGKCNVCGKKPPAPYTSAFHHGKRTKKCVDCFQWHKTYRHNWYLKKKAERLKKTQEIPPSDPS